MPNPFTPTPLTFSFIMPVWGESASTLPQSIGAIFDNDYPEVEVIVVFDGPHPSGVKTIKRLIAKYPTSTIRYLVIEHGGAPKARNAGAALAKGDILSFVDPDIYLYPDAIRTWANAFEEQPQVDVVWGLYDILINNTPVTIGGAVPTKASGQPEYWAFRFSNYCSGMFPMRKRAFVGWDESVVSLQDWDMWLRMLKQDNYQGTKFWYLARSFAATDPPRPGGISDDSHRHWLERVAYVKRKNGIPQSDMCVVSLGAPSHGITIAQHLGADYLPSPSYKPHNYKLIYLIGCYSGAPPALGQHMAVFADPDGGVKDLGNGFVEVTKYCSAKKVIHWIGTDVLELHWKCSFTKLKAFRAWLKEQAVTSLSEYAVTHDELAEVGIASEIVPIPPRTLPSELPLPDVFRVGIYENATQRLYHEDLMAQVARAMPDIEFVFYGDQTRLGEKTDNSTHLGFIPMGEWLPQLSCCLRVTVHDGLPLNPLEFLMAGRQVVTNVKLAGTIGVTPDVASIIAGIRQAQATPLDPQWPEYWRSVLNLKTYQDTLLGLLYDEKTPSRRHLPARV